MIDGAKILPEKPNTLIKYGKTVILNESDKTDFDIEPDKEFTADKNTKQILNIILPPIFFYNESEELCYQQVVNSPARISDIVNLQRRLDEELARNQIRETGICPMREKLYGECFDELIRQITINCSHKGIMLVRVRDEMRMSIDTYQKLYISSLAFGLRSAFDGYDKECYLKGEIERYENEIQGLEKEIADMEADLEGMDERERQEIEQIKMSFQESKNTTTNEHGQLKENLKDIFGLLKESAL